MAAMASRSAALLLLDDRLALDVGALYTRCGVCGEPAPRRIVAHEPIMRAAQGVAGTRRHGQQAVLFSDDAGQDQVSRLHERLVDHLQEIFLRVLLMDPKGKRIVLVDNVLAPVHAKLALARCLFEDFQVQSCTFYPSPLLAVLTTGHDTGLVVDVGYRDATVTPVYDGRPLFPLVHAAPVAGASVNARLRTLLLEQAAVVAADGTTQPLHALGADAAAWLSLATLEQIKSVVVSADDRTGSIDLAKAEGQIVRVPPSVSHAAVAHLFEGDDDGRSLPRLVLEALLACPIDVRTPVATRVLLVGGTTSMPGFAARLGRSIRALAAGENRFSALRSLADRLAIVPSPFSHGSCAWTGGGRADPDLAASAAGVLGTRGYEVTRETFARAPGVPDWSAMAFSDAPVDSSEADARW